MDVTDTEIDVLRQLQEVDRARALAQRNLDALPQPQEILAVRKQKATILEKKVQVQDMLDSAEDELMKFFNEDEKLAAKQAESESTLQNSKGDFRSVEARSKELNGIVKRRRHVADEMMRVEGQINKIKPVMAQVLEALKALDAKEAQLIASYQAEGGTLKQLIADAEKKHAVLQEQLDTHVYKLYDQTQQRCGGIGLSFLEGATCSVCRTTFDQGKLSMIRSEAPLSSCPNCRRLLVVDEG